MDQFKSWMSYGQFIREVARHRRYVRTPDAQDFLRVVAATCKARLLPVPSGRTFWRAQLGHDSQMVGGWEQEVAYRPLRMKPSRLLKFAVGRPFIQLLKSAG
jgi:hypothetical protein